LARGGRMHDVEQLRRDLEEAVAELSPDARRAWDTLEDAAGRVAAGEDVAPEMPPEYDDLLPSEQAALLRVVPLSGALYAARAEEEEGMVALMYQLEGVIGRAQELEPGLGEGVTLGEAVAAPKRHGVSAGISPELEDLVVEAPAGARTEEEVAALVRGLLDVLSPPQRQVRNVRMNTRGGDENPAEILAEVLALSDDEAREYMEDFEKLVKEVVDEVADERDRRRRRLEGR
jgi:hypothetical protein